MRILVFVQTFANPTLTFIYNEVTELAKHHQVKIVTCERKHEDLFPFADVTVLPKVNFLKKLRYKLQVNDFEIGFKNRAYKKAIGQIVDDFRPDVIHTHFGFESWHFLLNFRRADIPIFISFHGFDASHKLNSKRYLQTLKRVFERPNINPIFVSNFMQKQVEQKLKINIPQARILYYGTDIAFFNRQSYDHPKAPFTFLQVSSFAHKKGHEFTIRAFARFLTSPPSPLSFQERGSIRRVRSSPLLKGEGLGVRLLLAGEGLLLKPMQALVDELGISDSVQFLGLVNREQAKALMETAHVFVHHSVTSKPVGDMEGIPNALMEAMAMELPVLSTIHSGIPELVQDGVNGYLVAEEDVEAYAQRMRDVLEWNYLPKNREKVAQNFEKQQHAKQLIGFYKETLDFGR